MSADPRSAASVRLPDLIAVPVIGSPEREAHEEAALARGRELLHKNDGSIRDALYDLEIELRDPGSERDTRKASDLAREYARSLVNHVEQCWATAVLL